MKPKNILFAIVLVFFFISENLFSQLKINEYSCANVTGGGTLTDSFGNTPDWIELYNPTTNAINIEGFFLSDDASNLGKWQFPLGSTIAAQSYLLIYCSGQNTVIPATPEYHTNFKLTQTQPEKIILSNSFGTVIDSLTLRQHQKDHSWARNPDGSNNWYVYTNPTEGATNNGTIKVDFFFGYLNPPSFSQLPGKYSAFQLTLSAPTGLGVKYTTNGTDPVAGTLYVGIPINILSTTAVRAYTYDPTGTSGYLGSFIETNTYFIPSNIYTPTAGFTYDIVSCTFDTSALFNNQTINFSTMEFFDKNYTFKFETGGTTNKHGNDSWAFPQKGFDYECDDEYGYSYTNNYQFFQDPKLGFSPRKKFQKIIFKAGASDNFPSGGNNAGGNGFPAHMRDAFCQSYAFRKNLNMDGRRYKPVIIFLNGKYWGVYELREKFDDDYTDYYYNQKDIHELQYWGGYVGNSTAAAQTDWANVYNFIMNNSMNVPSNYFTADSLLNFGSLIDYMFYNSYVVNSDFINWNSAWWRGLDPNQGKKKWRYWMWDMDNTWGLGENFSGLPTTSFDSNPCDYETTFPPSTGAALGHAAILQKLLTNDTFKGMYINRYADLLNTSFNCDSILDHFNYFRTFLSPEMSLHNVRWNGNDSVWNRNMDTLRYWITQRCEFIENSIKSCYGVTGPFDFCVDYSPPGSGLVQFNSLTLNAPYSGQYFGGVLMSAIAVPNPNYYFDHWETSNFILPDSIVTNDTIQWLFDSTSCIKAIFKLKEPYNLEGDPMIPTGFTPNGDGQNDLLNVYGTLRASDFNLEIFNRWGQLVFSSSDKTVGWDGKFKGSDAPIGVYAYKFKVTIDGTETFKSGSITLIR